MFSVITINEVQTPIEVGISETAVHLEVIVAENTGASMNVSSGAKTNADAGVFGQISITDDYMYICVMSGNAGSAIWKKTVLFQV